MTEGDVRIGARVRDDATDTFLHHGADRRAFNAHARQPGVLPVERHQRSPERNDSLHIDLPFEEAGEIVEPRARSIRSDEGERPVPALGRLDEAALDECDEIAQRVASRHHHARIVHKSLVRTRRVAPALLGIEWQRVRAD